MKLTNGEQRSLAQIARRDWPAGEPRLTWVHKATGRNLLAKGLISERPGTEGTYGTGCIVDLTDAGRDALRRIRSVP